MADSRRKKALDRAVKFYRQSTSSNKHEADTARRRLEEAFAAHGFTQADIDEAIDAEEKVYEDAGALGDDFWPVRIALALSDRTGCRAVKKDGRLIFEGTKKRTTRAASAYARIARDVQVGCDGVYASWGHPSVFAPVLRPILIEEAARAVAERVLGQSQPKVFPVSPELQRELLLWSRGMTGSESCGRMHMEFAREGGRKVGLAMDLGEI